MSVFGRRAPAEEETSTEPAGSQPTFLGALPVDDQAMAQPAESPFARLQEEAGKLVAEIREGNLTADEAADYAARLPVEVSGTVWTLGLRSWEWYYQAADGSWQRAGA